jgi:hypothetical protein
MTGVNLAKKSSAVEDTVVSSFVPEDEGVLKFAVPVKLPVIYT